MQCGDEFAPLASDLEPSFWWFLSDPHSLLLFICEETSTESVLLPWKWIAILLQPGWQRKISLVIYGYIIGKESHRVRPSLSFSLLQHRLHNTAYYYPQVTFASCISCWNDFQRQHNTITYRASLSLPPFLQGSNDVWQEWSESRAGAQKAALGPDKRGEETEGGRTEKERGEVGSGSCGIKGSLGPTEPFMWAERSYLEIWMKCVWQCVVPCEGDVISSRKCSQASPKQRVVHDSNACKPRFTLDLNRTLKVDRDLFAVGCSLIFLGCALLEYFGGNDWFYFVELLRFGCASLPFPIIYGVVHTCVNVKKERRGEGGRKEEEGGTLYLFIIYLCKN